MSTRATYKINNTTIYIHHDGYEQGAATYFYNAMITENKAGNLETYFLRANEKAEITESHESHGDTEYRYNIIGTGYSAIVQCLERIEWSPMEFKEVCTLNILDFIDKYSAGSKDYKPFKKIKIGYSERFHNEVTILRAMEESIACLNRWDKNPNISRKSANWENAVQVLIDYTEFPGLKYDLEKIAHLLPSED